ncbi:hypothetical protein J1N35_029598 [Gossypium stocksii]|uniref:Uncharacterized protein n=1 Tax=Gossypium stocksii TaxID=47602 RepID=A0A9D3ZS72_9ROSI|nr:hypothetical protein J1N35_029598 [Gossypium stocksii]
MFAIDVFRGICNWSVLFRTVSFISFLLISHGYCITCERLSVIERRTTAALGCVFYLTLIGYRAFVPYFTLKFVKDEDVQPMRDAVYMKYKMCRKFQGAMQIVAMAEIVFMSDMIARDFHFQIYINIDNSSENYWLRLLVREWAQFCIFLYIGYWTFRSQELAPRFSVMPTLKSKVDLIVPPIYRIEMDATTFREFQSHEWRIGMPTSVRDERSRDSVLVIIQHPNAYPPTTTLSSRKQPV